MDPRAESLTIKRLRILARAALFWGFIIFLRLLDLQIIDHEKYSRRAEQQHDDQVEIRAPRGAIYDRNGQPLAMSAPVDSVVINPMLVRDPVIAAELVSKVLDLDQSSLMIRIAGAIDSKRGFLWVKRKITPEESDKLRSFKLEWIEFRPESSRYYPNGQLAAHILGGVDYEEKGNGGIEHSLNQILAGRPGLMRTSADVRGNVFDVKVFSHPVPGTNVTLTIDERIQLVAEKELAAAVKEHGAKTGSLVVMRPVTGEVLAIANYPTYDPNIAPKPGENVDSRTNLAVTAPFEPGSVFKVFTLATALETTRLKPTSMFHCGNGSMTLFRRVIHDDKPNGMLTIADILAKSSNIGAIKVGLEVGNSKMYEYIRKFGFGSRTGVPLPGESTGVVRRPSRWIASSIGSIAMGHELSTTTLQLAQACSVVANGGMLVKPKLVISKHREGSVELEPSEKPERVLRPEVAIAMRRMMEGVVLHGTGRRAHLNGYTSGGKTGSAQIYDYHGRVYTHRYNGSFIGFAPVSNPAIVVAVTLNNTQSGDRGFGGRVAAPTFRKVASAALRFLDVPRDMPEDAEPTNIDEGSLDSDLAIAGLSDAPGEDNEQLTMVPEPSSTPRLAGPEAPPVAAITGPIVPDFQGKTKRDVLAESMALGFRVEIAGAGIARSQDPPPGVVLGPGERVKVHFAR